MIRAFSLIELVFVVAITGILSLAFLHLQNPNPTICIQKLEGFLASMQDEISRAFMHSYLTHKSFDVDQILKTKQFKSTPACKLTFKNQKIQVQAYNLKTTFSFQAMASNTAPKLSCPLSNSLCKKLNNRLLSK